MKKFYLLFCAAALLAAGCDKEVPEDKVPDDKVPEDQVPEDNPPAGPAALTASVESIDDATTFTWAKGDVIALQTATGFEDITLTGDGGVATGSFECSSTPADGAVSVFPAAVAGSVSGNNLTVNLPATYTYAAGQTNAVYCAKVAESKLSFTHLSGFVAIELKGVPAGAKLVFTAKDKKISGAYTVDLSAATPQLDVTAAEAEADSTLTVTFPEAVSEAVAYLPLPAGEYPSWTVKVTAADDAVIKEVSATAQTISRKTINAMPCMVVAIKDWFVSPEGAGAKNGSSWDDAMDQAAFNEFINYDQNGAEFTKAECDVFNGSTIHFAEGKYNFLAHSTKDRFKLQFTNMGEACNISFKGGYAADSKGTDLSKRDAAKYVTKLTGDANNNDQADRADDTGIFCTDNWAYLTFDGITFTCAGGKNVGSGTTHRQGAFVANSDKGTGSLTFTDCTFKDLISSDYVTDSGSNKGCGSALFIMNNYTVSMTDCVVENCTSNHVGGAICVAAGTSKLTAVGCSFKNCVSENTHGGAISSGEGAPLTIKNCTFDSCVASQQGGAVYANKATVADIENCTFTKCSTVKSSGGKGAAIGLDKTNSPVANVRNCVFDACQAADQGAAVALQASAVAKLDGCIVKNCITRNRGAFRLESESVLFMNNCAVYDNTTTEQWGGAMASSGGHFLINNCSFENNSVAKNGAILNGAGAWAIVNSTVVSNTDVSGAANTAVRWDTGKPALIMNSMIFYTGSQTDADDSAIYPTKAENTMVNGGYNVYNTAANFVAAETDKVGSPLSAYGLTWNTDHYIWNGLAADASKATLAAIEEALKTQVNYATGSFTNLGLDFYNWLQEIGGGKNPLAYDQKGNARDVNAMWPGAYEKH